MTAPICSPPTLAVDFGERRIGLAVTDSDGRLAVPIGTLDRQTDRRALYQIADIAAARGIASLVVGEPRLLDGQPSPNLERVRRFGVKLARITALPLFWVEETLSTQEADSRIADTGRSARCGDRRRDAVAAQILLEDALAGGGRRHRDSAAGGPEVNL